MFLAPCSKVKRLTSYTSLLQFVDRLVILGPSREFLLDLWL